MLAIKKNTAMYRHLGADVVEFIDHALGAITRLLPHVKVSNWTTGTWENSRCTWTSTARNQMKVIAAIGNDLDRQSWSLSATVTRQQVDKIAATASMILDQREHQLCGLIVRRVSEILSSPSLLDAASLKAVSTAFDEYVVAQSVNDHHGLKLDVSTILGALHTLSQQSYENKALSFGCILDPSIDVLNSGAHFPSDFLALKKYKALSDGYRTAYLISNTGTVVDLVEMAAPTDGKFATKHYYPNWAEGIALESMNGRCAISLSRQGDILIFESGTLRFTYRFGKWQYWNHNQYIKLLNDRARAQGVKQRAIGYVVKAIYRAALDVSFRRCGGMFVILSAKKNLREIVRNGDAIADNKRSLTDSVFDKVISQKTIQSLPRPVVVELASLDGSVVMENSGKVLAFGAVLRQRRNGHLRDSEGSRTKAAIGASNYGITIKISSDGEISVYYKAKLFFTV
ncbi:MAG: diadenylate cyclase [Pseudomonadota bacterium]